jgi:hypothetical protein
VANHRRLPRAAAGGFDVYHSTNFMMRWLLHPGSPRGDHSRPDPLLFLDHARAQKDPPVSIYANS